jgi:hypothetical protein
MLRLGKPLTYLRRQVLAFREAVEKATVEAYGEITIAHAKTIRTACVAVKQSLRLERVLATQGEPGQGGLDHAQWLAYSDRLLRAEETADRALSRLGIDKRTSPDVWDSIYRTYASSTSDTTTTNGQQRQTESSCDENSPQANVELADGNKELEQKWVNNGEV